MPEAPGTGGPVEVTLDGTHLRVDARPARLVSMLRPGGASVGGPAVLTVQREGGESVTRPVPDGARQVTFLVHGELTVEATAGADFVALAAEGGRRVVVAFNGEVVVLPSGSEGDRFALGAHEALLMSDAEGAARVVPVDDLSDEDQDEISTVMEAAALAEVGPTDPGPVTPAADEPTTSSAPVPAAAAGAAAAKAGGAQRGSSKKGKKGRPQPSGKKQPPLVPAAATTGAGVRKAGAVSGATKKSPAAKKTAVSGKAVATATSDDGYEDTPGDRRAVLIALLVAAVIAALVGVLFLTNDSGDDTDLAADSTTTTESSNASTTSVPVAVTSTVPATTTSAPATTTSAAPTTTVATTTTVAPPPAPAYTIEPKSCVQNANNSITYSATITNTSTATHDYTIAVVFRDDKNVAVARSDANVAKLVAGRSADFSATGTPDRDLANTGNCHVDRVDARPSA